MSGGARRLGPLHRGVRYRSRGKSPGASNRTARFLPRATFAAALNLSTPLSTALTRSVRAPAPALLVVLASSASSTGSTRASLPPDRTRPQDWARTMHFPMRWDPRFRGLTCVSQTCFATRSTTCGIIVPNCGPPDKHLQLTMDAVWVSPRTLSLTVRPARRLPCKASQMKCPPLCGCTVPSQEG